MHRDRAGRLEEVNRGHRQMMGHHTKKDRKPLLGQQAFCRSRMAEGQKQRSRGRGREAEGLKGKGAEGQRRRYRVVEHRIKG